MGMSMGGGGGVKAEPNVTPMIDVMLVLLIIFMIVVPAINAGFQAVPPQGVNLKAHPEGEGEVVLGIDNQGRYYVDKKPVRTEDLEQFLKNIYDNRTTDKVLYVKADKDLDYAKLLDALDIAGRAGARVTGMITEQQNGTQSSVAGDNDTK
jgi:biopolymer transport protein TolR